LYLGLGVFLTPFHRTKKAVCNDFFCTLGDLGMLCGRCSRDSGRKSTYLMVNMGLSGLVQPHANSQA
ncbi:hypothetical protein, partial [Salmonella enterica]|uniref:hypothetical protein n=1 Tax=Salmonella enterica TaxID=28901 RepID=UPI003523D1F8